MSETPEVVDVNVLNLAFFWSNVETKNVQQCWEWRGGLSGSGYGRFYVRTDSGDEGEQRLAHRLSWEMHFGAVPEDLYVLHKCDNRKCVNPLHLFVGTQSDNMRDCASKGRVCTIGKSRATHCSKGHEFTVENTYYKKDGHRDCRICIKARKVAWDKKNNARALLARLGEGGEG